MFRRLSRGIWSERMAWRRRSVVRTLAANGPAETGATTKPLASEGHTDAKRYASLVCTCARGDLSSEIRKVPTVDKVGVGRGNIFISLTIQTRFARLKQGQGIK